jgi:hypothetical protein
MSPTFALVICAVGACIAALIENQRQGQQEYPDYGMPLLAAGIWPIFLPLWLIHQFLRWQAWRKA